VSLTGRYTVETSHALGSTIAEKAIQELKTVPTDAVVWSIKFGVYGSGF
jgi:hypothetical protein